MKLAAVASCSAVYLILCSATASGAGITLNPNNITVTLQRGATRPVAVTVSLSGASTAGVSIVASTQSGGNWLSVNTRSLTVGTSAASFNLTVNAAALNPGSYVGTVTVDCVSGAACNTATLSIFTIVPGVSALQPVATSISLSTPSNLQAGITVFSTDGSSLSFTATVSPGSPWLTVTQTSTTTPSSLTVTADPGSLATGTYTGTILLTAASGAPAVPIQVTFAVQSSGGTGGTAFSIAVSPSTLEIQTFQAKKTFTFPQVRATGSGTANLTIGSTTSDGAPWLSATLSSPTIAGGGNPVNITVTADPNPNPKVKLSNGSYSGTITITATPGNAVTISVMFTVYQGADESHSPEPLAFTLFPNQKLPMNVTLTVASASAVVYDGDGKSFVTVPPSSWLSATASGFTIVVFADATSLLPGTYSASIKVTGKVGPDPQNAGTPIVVVIHVTATVGGVAPAGVTADQTSLSFPLSAGGTAAQSTINLTAGTPTSFNAAITSGSPWLQVSSNAPATPAVLTVIAAPSSMPPGTYFGNIRIAPAGSATIDIPVTMTLTATAALSIDTAPITLTAQVGGACTPKTVAISSSAGGVVLPYSSQTTIQSPPGGGWLTVTSPNGNTPGAISVSCNSAGLAAGVYSGLLSVTSVFASNSPVAIPVTLNIAAGTALSASPSSAALTLTLTTGGICSSQQIAVSSTAPSSGVAWATTSTVTSGPNWITLTDGFGTTPGTFTISCIGSGLKSGIYSGSVKISAGASSTTVNVSLAVSDVVVPTTGSGLYFIPVSPCHLVDTRPNQAVSGPYGPPIFSDNETRTFYPALGSCAGISQSAIAFSFTVTAMPTKVMPYLTIWPAGQPIPDVSTLNAFSGGKVSNSAIVPAGVGGGVNVYVTDQSDVQLDINGYFDSAPSPSATSFYTLDPCRVADTRRLPNGTFNGPGLTAGATRDFPVASSLDPNGKPCVPPNAKASAYSLNVTAAPAGALDYVVAWPSGSPKPQSVITLGSPAGATLADAAIVQASSSGSVSVYASDPTDVLLDVNGYFGVPGAAGALLFHPLPPCRVANTRDPTIRPLGGPIMKADSQRTFPLATGSCNIPPGAKAYSLNVTVVPTSLLSFATLFPTGQARPGVSTLNDFTGITLANAAIVPVGNNDSIDVYVTNESHVILDINGYFSVK